MENKLAFSAFGLCRHYEYETCKAEIPLFWKETADLQIKYGLCGMFGISFNNDDTGFDYLIADLYQPWRTVPDECQTVSYPAGSWAVFSCTGKVPDALQQMNTKIFSEWLPAHEHEYRFWTSGCIEVYTPVDPKTGDMYMEIWIPLERI